MWKGRRGILAEHKQIIDKGGEKPKTYVNLRPVAEKRVIANLALSEIAKLEGLRTNQRRN